MGWLRQVRVTGRKTLDADKVWLGIIFIKNMKIIRDNSPYLLGFVAYWAYYTASFQLIWLGIWFVILRYLSPPSDFFNFILTWGLASLLSYLSFLASTRWITLPMIKRFINIPIKNEQGSLTMNWVLFIIFIFIFGRFPLGFLQMLPIEKEIQNFVSFVWMAIISFDMYKDAISNYAFKTKEEEKPENENGSQTQVV
jgi:hypothetical protein